MDKAFRRYAIRRSKISDIAVRTIKLYESIMKPLHHMMKIWNRDLSGRFLSQMFDNPRVIVINPHKILEKDGFK